jgi:site-specific recombinase XerD
MKTVPSAALFTRVESFFTDNLQRMRGASEHTVHAYRDALKLFFEFVAANKRCSLSGIDLGDMNAETVSQFLVHLEQDRSIRKADGSSRASSNVTVALAGVGSAALIHSTNGAFSRMVTTTRFVT